MNSDEFRHSLTASEPPAGLMRALAGLWWDAKGDWERAHESSQQNEGVKGSWVHAYLHRKEGYQGNAAYWYSRAGKPVCREPLNTEWLSIVTALLKGSGAFRCTVGRGRSWSAMTGFGNTRTRRSLEMNFLSQAVAERRCKINAVPLQAQWKRVKCRFPPASSNLPGNGQERWPRIS
jgi:hypothetical protein